MGFRIAGLMFGVASTLALLQLGSTPASASAPMDPSSLGSKLAFAPAMPVLSPGAVQSPTRNARSSAAGIPMMGPGPPKQGRGSSQGQMQKGSTRQSERMRKDMLKKDFEKNKKQWVLVAKIAEDLPELGATKLVTAGKSPGGVEYPWCLVRGGVAKVPAASPGDGAEGDAKGDAKASENEGTQVFAVDGACRCCRFPLPTATFDTEADGEPTLTCACCGTKYSLKNGNCIEFMPANNPLQWAAMKLDSGGLKDKPEMRQMAIVPTRVTKAGNVFVRVPDGTPV
jgi:nitrite reductase/ring-hydroxylating ferredoxin subunit